jgi:excisionase family DNA binding protein
MPDQLLHSASEAAVRLGIGRSRFYELLASGEVESIRIGGRRLVPADALLAYVARLRAEQSSAREPLASA